MAQKSRKVFATTATAALVASAVAPIASSAAGFSDVTKPEYKTAIDALAEAGILNGYENGTFKPENKVTRGEVAKVITLIRHLEEGTKTPFKDVKDGYWSTQYINSLYAAKLVNGYEDGTFKPEGNVTRAEFAKLVVDAYGLTLTNAATPFTDVKAGNWATPYIQTAYANGLIKGVTASKFDPSAPIKRGDLAILLHRADSKFGDVIGNNFPGVELVKATNNTTVEVTFKDEVDAKDVQAAKFSIEGLTVSNAAVKQTDSKTVVLTTSAQEGGKQYTVKSGSATLGKFIGASAVVPTAINVTTPSVQGTIGKEVTLKAEVTVEAGKSKAGIPVTFNIVSDNTNLNSKIEVEALTDENGVASYSYTRYYKHNDNVTAYATQKSQVFSSGKVYWAEGLSLTEATEGNDLANGSKKVYKIKTDSYQVEKDAAGKELYKYVNVAFAENVNVTPDKLVRDVEVLDAGVSTNAKYPSQVTTGGVNEVRVKVDEKGEATFTITGSNASVTPVVFVDSNKDGKFGSTELQASAKTVKFALNHTLGLTVKAEGVQNAAAINAKGTGEGGRDYTVTITDKNGKVAPDGTVAYVTFAEGSYSTDKAAYILDANGDRVLINKNTVLPIKVTGNKGEATFTLVGARDAFAAPTVFIENGKEAGLDKADLQAVGETTYFVDAVVNSADLKVKNAAGKVVETLPSSQSAFFHYGSVDQNGFDYYTGTGSYEVSYQVTAHFADVTVRGTFGSKVVKKGTTETVKVQATNGKAVLEVNSENVASNVSVQASASQVSLPNKTASIEFTKGTQIPNVYTGAVESIDTVNNKLKFAGYDSIRYSTKSFKNEQGIVIDETRFEKLVSDALAAGNTVSVTAVKNEDGTYTLELESIGAPVGSTGTISSANLSVDGKTLTLTFDKNLVASSVDLSDFVITTGTVDSVASVAGNTVVLKVNGTTSDVDTTDTIGVAADQVTFTDGTSNAVISGIAIAQPNASKISTLTTTQANQTAVSQVDAKGSVSVGSKSIKAVVKSAETKQAAYNGLKLTFVQDGTSSGDPTASYNGSTREIKVSLGLDDTNNTLTKINAAIAAATPATHGDVTIANVELAATSDVPTFAEVATPVVISLTGGVNEVTPAQAGIYTFTITTNLVVGDKVTLNGKTYVAGPDFVIGSTAAKTAENLAAKIKATDSRFATAVAASGTITLTDAVINNAAAPTLSFN